MKPMVYKQAHDIPTTPAPELSTYFIFELVRSDLSHIPNNVIVKVYYHIVAVSCKLINALLNQNNVAK